jgi:hypothetical protein
MYVHIFSVHECDNEVQSSVAVMQMLTYLLGMLSRKENTKIILSIKSGFKVNTEKVLSFEHEILLDFVI